jgi:para-aminobenzoate synthetase
MLTLLIDNYDSFTFNLFQLLAEVNGREPIVVRNDAMEWGELERLGCDNVVISPGPGRPQREGDFGVCAEAIRRCQAPLLGVCLGMQGLGWVEGGTVARAPAPMHGRVAAVEHDGTGLFAGVPSPFEATRYHSLALARPLPSALRETASCEGVPMAVAHRTRPQWGVQFHPESVATGHGKRLLANFRDLTPAPSRASVRFVSHSETKRTSRTLTGVRVRRIDASVDPEAAFVSLYGESETAFWLDSSRAGERGRFSFMGDASGPLAEVIHHQAGEGEPLLDRLQRRLEELRPAELPELPFEFDCGFVGYLGYELKAECGFSSPHPSEHPDAALIFCDRLLAFDHETGQTHLLALYRAGGEAEEEGANQSKQAAESWIALTAQRLESLAAAREGEPGEPRRTPPAVVRRGSPGSPPAPPSATNPNWSRDKPRYLEDIETCQAHLQAGDSYELCLTNQLQLQLDEGPLDLYLRLRRANPAPFAAYLRFGGLAVLSSSPERFLRVGRAGEAEARPIKGTSRRGESAAEDAALAAALAADPKNRAENLMIVDLLRNDLGAVCEVGSVAVPAMMAVESYETVHQLVSEVRGRLRPGATATDCVRSCFPPGSMTGAPKRRATEILDRLEGEARGVYSGAVGWFGLGGAADLSVAIRTVVQRGERATIGAGGAIVLQSDPDSEHDEMLLKAAAALRAVCPDGDPAAISLAGSGAAGVPR